MKGVDVTTDITQDERTKYIGGSDCASLLGRNGYSPYL